jgi:hypothetical protein
MKPTKFFRHSVTTIRAMWATILPRPVTARCPARVFATSPALSLDSCVQQTDKWASSVQLPTEEVSNGNNLR